MRRGMHLWNVAVNRLAAWALRHYLDLNVLLAQAGMDQDAFATKVVRGTDGRGRFAVDGARDLLWGDCAAVGFMVEGQSSWHYSHLSSARARILAYHLIMAAQRLEATSSEVRCIDKRETE